LGLPRPIIKSHAEEREAWPCATGIPKIWGFTFNIYTMAEAREFKFGTHLGLPWPTIKPHPEYNWAWHWVRKAPIYLGFTFNISETAALSS